MVEARVSGIPDLRAELAALPDKLRKRAVRNALAAGARLVRTAAQQAIAPHDLSPSSPAVRAGRRGIGTVRKAITVRTSKAARRGGDVGVFVNVRPARGGNAGANRPTDPYYWRWLEFGWNPSAGPQRNSAKAKRERRRLNQIGADKARSGIGFLHAGAAQLGAALGVIMPKLQAAVAKLDTPKAPAP
jgi:hypothetical protein